MGVFTSEMKDDKKKMIEDAIAELMKTPEAFVDLERTWNSKY